MQTMMMKMAVVLHVNMRSDTNAQVDLQALQILAQFSTSQQLWKT